MLAIVAAALCLWVTAGEGYNGGGPMVHLPHQGALLGEIWTSYSGQEFAAFRTVPYAASPVGEFRFLPPQVPERWEGVRHSSQQATTGVEDCLFLNIYTRVTTNVSRSDGDRPSPLPVMFFIHGGGFFSGDGTTDVYGPDYFMDEEVVLVTINYRLGPLGFLCLEEDSAPCNLGLRDLIKGLEWVRDNIELFGGDSNNVHIFGHSAGSMLVHYIMFSPKAKGLFHSAAALSGPVVSSYLQWDKRPKLYAKRMAKEMGCDQETTVELLNCLRAIPALDFADQTTLFLHLPWTGPNVWKPVPDGHFSGDPVLPGDPEALLAQGKYHQVPLVTGLTSDEGAFAVVGNLIGKISFEEIDARWEQLGPLILFHRSVDEITPKDVELAWRVREFYFGGPDAPLGDFVKDYVKMMGDHMFLSGQDRMLKLMFESGNHSAPVYRYVYSHDSIITSVDPYRINVLSHGLKLALNYFLDYEIFELGLGVAHADELVMLFAPHRLPVYSRFSEDDRVVGERFVKLLTTFAASKGDPDSFNRDFSDTFVSGSWNPLTREEWSLCLEINAQQPRLRVRDFEDLERRARFWDQVWTELLGNTGSKGLSSKPVKLAVELDSSEKSVQRSFDEL